MSVKGGTVDAFFFFFTACSHCIYQQGILRKPSTNTTSVWLDTAVTISNNNYLKYWSIVFAKYSFNEPLKRFWKHYFKVKKKKKILHSVALTCRLRTIPCETECCFCLINMVWNMFPLSCQTFHFNC